MGGRSSQRHNREIHGIDSAGELPSDYGETYNNLSGGRNPYEPPGAAVEFVGTIPTLEGVDEAVFTSYDTSGHFIGTDTPFTYTVQAGTLPTGLTLNSGTGVISGTATVVGTEAGIVVRATDATAADTADSNAFSIIIAAGAAVEFQGTVPNATENQNVAITPIDLSTYFVGTDTPFTYALTTGTLPTGLSLDTNTGIISGTPTVIENQVGISVTATDATGADTAITNTFAINILA
jgi:hypothetical protein